MADKEFRSKLFQAQPNQLFLDERVSKIELPMPLEMETEALDDENLAILMEEESEESEEQEVLQIFVGSAASEVKPEETWNIQEEDDFQMDLDSEEESDEFEAGETLQITPIAIKSATVIPTTTRTLKANITQRVLEPDGENELDEWEEIDWDDVTLSDILGEADEYFTQTNEDAKHGESLEMWLDDDIPEPIASAQSLEKSPSSENFSFEALFTDEFNSTFDPLEGFSYEKELTEEDDSEDKISVDLDDELPPFQVETEWWQHPFLIFVLVLLSTMTLFMILLQVLKP
jgi:hypothetical protein